MGLSAVVNGSPLTNLYPASSAAPLDQVETILPGDFILFHDFMPNAEWRVASFADLNTRFSLNFGTNNRIERLVPSMVPGSYGIPSMIYEVGPAPTYTASYKYVPALAGGLQSVTVQPPAGYMFNNNGIGISGKHVAIRTSPISGAPPGSQPGFAYYTCE